MAIFQNQVLGMHWLNTMVRHACSTMGLFPDTLWFNSMSMGAATAFTLTIPAAKITNLGAMKIVLGAKLFIIYLAFVFLFAFVSGMLVNIFL